MVSIGFDVEPVTANDIPRLAEISTGTGWPDAYVQLRFRNPDHMRTMMSNVINATLRKPGWTYIKAVDRETKVVAAWASWCIPLDEEIQQRSTVPNADSASSVTPSDSYERFGKYVEEHRESIRNQWLKLRRHMEFASLFTDTGFRGRGMGNALTAQALKTADAQSLPVFIQASPKAWAQVYVKKGFNVIAHLDVDCKEWVPGEDAGQADRGYGIYKIRWMIRLPETVTVK